ncbi:MAG: TetR/AcrR family transcriptional regulator [Thermoleophilaceae bacterium]|nr:TetR/AcrR family transcriptional regulator [Thermoleophilaceae bacterium]
MAPGPLHSLPEAPERLPRGPHRLAREVVLASQRGRMLGAMAEAVAEKGYAATTVADVVGRAGVSRKTFYEHFRDKEECFLAAWDVGVQMLLDAIADATQTDDWRAGLRAGVRAYLETLSAEPAFARTFMIEVLAAGPAALERRAEVHRRFAEQLRELYARAREQHPELPEPPAEVFSAIVGAVHELTWERVREDRFDELVDLAPVIAYLEVALLAGHEQAVEELER